MSEFDAEYKDSIQERMRKQFEELSKKTDYEGSFSSDIIEANSIEFENAKAEMNLMVEAAFAGTSWGDFLTARCAEYGVDRKAAMRAIGEVTFTGTAGKEIPAGTAVCVKDGAHFRTEKPIKLDENGKGTVAIKCTEYGAKGNVKEGTINTLPISVFGVKSVTNEKPTGGGVEEETDDELYKRYYRIVRTPATSGNKYHYYNWSMSVDGVGACKVIPCGYGAGTVKIIILDGNMQTCNQDTIKRVSDYIESVRPIGATVKVISPIPVSLNITGEVVGVVDKDALTQAINKYLKEKNLELKTISAVQIGKMLMNQDTIEDYNNLLINGKARIKVSDEEMFTVGKIELNKVDSIDV